MGGSFEGLLFLGQLSSWFIGFCGWLVAMVVWWFFLWLGFSRVVVRLCWCLVGFVGGYGVVDDCGSGGVAVEWLVAC